MLGGMSRYERIYEIVRRFPPGRVASYGQVAEAAGFGRGAARQVGYALHALKDDAVPWQRVVNRHGEIRLRHDPGYQHDRLSQEGVPFDERGRVARKAFVPTSALLD